MRITTKMKRILVIAAIGLTLAVGLTSGFFIGRSKALADNIFWQGVVSGIVVTAGTDIPVSESAVVIAPDSVGKSFYLTGQQFDLKDLQMGKSTTLVLFARNNTKKIANVYPVITSSPNVEVQNPLGDAHIYPNGWAQFVFQIKAIATGPYSIHIGFKNE